MNEPRVSIIIPAYNAAEFIATSCGCALAQTERDIEVIVVDDGSADNTSAIVNEIAERDSRVKLVHNPDNHGRLEARRHGIEQAQGTFTLFLDADDEILPDMAQRLLEEQAGQYDIVQCGFELRYLDYVSPEDRRFNEDFNRPPATTATGDDVTHVVFRDRRTTWSLCGKLMRTPLLKEAIDAIPASSLTQAEDACTYFIVSCLADSYKGLPEYSGYIYNIDLGGSDARWKNMDLEQFAYSCRYVDSMDAIRAYLEQSGKMAQLADDYAVVRYEHVRAVADKLIRYVDAPVKPQAFDLFASAWAPAEAVAGLCEAGWDAPADCFEAVAKARALHCPPRDVEHEIKTVAAYHYSMGIGGAEEVTADLVRLWHAQGLRVVLFCDEPRSACAHELPKDVTWVELPDSASMERGSYAARAHLIADAVRDLAIDALVYHQWWNRLIAWDLMLLKMLGVPVCCMNHSIFMGQFMEPNPPEYDHSRIERHADALVVLSEADKRFWSTFNPRVRCTVNPVTTPPETARRSPLTGKDIVWVGRLSSFDKQPQEAIEIMARVVARDPECTLTLVGPAPSKRDLASLKARVKSLGIARNVEFVGPCDDPAPYYERASIHLLTSRFEGWGLVLAESKAHGLPCVMYDMPYLTLTQGERGIVSVPQGDRDAAAQAIAELLADGERRKELGQEAFEHITEIAAVDRAAFWNDLFAELGQGSPDRTALEADDLQWNLLVDAFKTSVEKAADLPVLSYTKRKGYKLARKAWHLIRRR